MVQKQKITRRRFIQILGAFGACATIPAYAFAEKKAIIEWDGISLGADSNIKLFHPNKDKAKYILKSALQEITRLEKMFSLYRDDSMIVELNKTGALNHPSKEFIEIIEKAKYFGNATNGQFDISVQPLWDKTGGIELVDYRNIDVNANKISFAKPNMQITLNGIAQGYITDKVTEILRNEGIDNALISLGEKYAIGAHPTGRDWKIGVEHSDEVVELNNKAIATSSNLNNQHIFNPKTGKTEGSESVTVITNNATKADALSTALYLGDLLGIERDQQIVIMKN